MDLDQSFRHFLSKIIAPSLRQQGLKRNGNTFYFFDKENVGLINIQKSIHSNSQEIKFTVNLGIISKKLQTVFSIKKNLEKPNLLECQWQKRLGSLDNNGKDIWWKINAETQIEELGNEILESILTFGIPEIKKYIDDISLRNLWISGEAPSLTEFQRLLYLLVFLKDIGPKELIESTIKTLRQISENKPSSITADVYINRLFQ